MMKRHLIIILCTLLPLMAMAQMRITGTVTDKNGAPLAGAIIQVRSNSTNKMIRFGKTDAKGSFTLETTADSYLEVSMLGFKKQRINLSENKPLRIVMQEETVALKEVTVKASKVREHGDTLTYNVATFADQNDRSIGDVLSRIPGFEVNKQNGQIKYEGKPISKFYIEGLDMLGGKYGVATNSLPQVDVGSVQVMRNHQPIRVLEDFTYTDEAAVNIRMKEGAKSHWVTSFNGGAGISRHTGLWKFEGFALRVKSDFQTMLTYKANNTGQDISKETTSLFSLDELENQSDYIELSPPTTPNLAESHTLFNRSHAVTLNTLKRFSESSQMNVQIIYNNNRETAEGERQTVYYLPDGNHIVDNRKDYLQKDNELYALVKYEHNSANQYLKNSLSGDFNWSRQWLNEQGTNNHHQFARKPEYDIKDNLYIIRKYGNRLVSFYSNNRIISRPQSLSVDSLYQHVSSQRYSTDTYAMGGIKLGRFSLSLKGGVNATLHRLKSDLAGLSERLRVGEQGSRFTLRLLADDSRFSFARFYVEPRLTYKTRDINIELTPTTEYLYEKYSKDDCHQQMLFSPDLSIRWYVTPRLRLSLGGSSSLESLDASRFHHSLILQDFQYINRGYAGYLHGHTHSIRGGITYNDALKALHTILSVSRTFSTSPYTPTRQFVGDYIILSAVEQESKSRSWQANLIASKGINIWNGVVNLRTLYINSDASMIQNGRNSESHQVYLNGRVVTDEGKANGVMTDYNSQMINARMGLDFSLWKDMHLRYGITFSQNRMKAASKRVQSDARIAPAEREQARPLAKILSMDYSQAIDNWKQDLSIIIPMNPFTIDLRGEYYRNEITSGNYKDFFLADIKARYKSKRLDLILSLNNLLNRDTYSYVVTSDLTSSTSTNRIRGRELLLTAYYKL